MVFLTQMVLYHVPLLLEPFLLPTRKSRKLLIVKKGNEVFTTGLFGIYIPQYQTKYVVEILYHVEHFE